MADSKNDITTNVEATEADVKELKKAQIEANPSTRLPPPPQFGVNPMGLNPEWLQRLKMGQKTLMINGIVRCIQVVDANTPQQHHCMSMVVNNLTTNETSCTRCTRPQTVGDARPRVINSSMIRLPNEDLKELGLTEDPLYGKANPESPVKTEKKPKRTQKDMTAPRRAKMPVPNAVKIEVTMKELSQGSAVTKVLLQKALEAIYELPVKNFREAEEIRIVKENVEAFLNREEQL